MKPNPNDNHESIHICSTHGLDICPMEHTEFKEGETVSIGVYCEQACDYELDI